MQKNQYGEYARTAPTNLVVKQAGKCPKMVFSGEIPGKKLDGRKTMEGIMHHYSALRDCWD
jgi:hypothetical protein